MENKHKIVTQKINGQIYAGEFTVNGSLYCAAMVPARGGWKWSLEKRLTTDKWINEWKKIEATFSLRRGVLTVAW